MAETGKKYYITHLVLIQERDQDNSIPIGMDEIVNSIASTLVGDTIQITRPFPPPAPLPPAPPPVLPKPLFRVRITGTSTIRDFAGKDTKRLAQKGQEYDIWEVLPTLGGYGNRGIIDRVTRENIWMNNAQRL